MDFPTPHREFSTDRSETSEASPALETPEPVVPSKRRRNRGGGTSTSGPRAAAGRVQKRAAGAGARERNEEAYTDDRRRNNQSARRSRLKRGMYMVEMDMAIKSYRRNVMEYKQAYETAKSVLVRHGLFFEDEMGAGFKEPELWKRPMFMAEQESDIADHRSKLEKAAKQADLPKLGLAFADKVYELVGRTVPLADKDSAVKALAAHHQKIEDCERKQYQLLLQLHEFERKMEETKDRMLDQQRRKQELDMAAEKYQNIGLDVDAEGGAQLEPPQDQVQAQFVPEGMELDHPAPHQGGDPSALPWSGISTLPVRVGQQPRQQQTPDNTRPTSKGKEVDTSDHLKLPPANAAVPPPEPMPAAEVGDGGNKAFLEEIEEFVQAGGMENSTFIKSDLYDDSIFSGLSGPGVDSEPQVFASDDLFSGPGGFPFYKHQAFAVSNSKQQQQQQQQLSTPTPGSAANTVVGASLGPSPSTMLNLFSSAALGTPTSTINWPGAGIDSHMRHNTPMSPPITQGIFLGNGANNASGMATAAQQQQVQNSQLSWPMQAHPTHPQYHPHPQGSGHQQQVGSTSNPMWNPYPQAMAQGFDEGWIEIDVESADDVDMRDIAAAA